MKKLLIKRNILIVSLALFMFWLTLVLLQETCNHSTESLCWQYWNTIGPLKKSVYISIPFLFFSLVAYAFREEVFRTWARFAIWWVPLSILFSNLSSDRPGHFAPSSRYTITLLCFFLFIFISSGIIITQSIKFRKKSMMGSAKIAK